jgi:serine/threonine protein kinase
LKRVVGRGGLGVVYEAFADGERVALKLLNQPADDIASRRLAREYKELSAVDHRNIVRVLDSGVHEEQPYLVMEFVDGSPLRRYLDFHQDDPAYAPRPPPPPPDDSVSVTHGGTSVSQSGSVALAWLESDPEPDSLTPLPRPAPTAVTESPLPLTPAQLARINRPSRIVRLRDVMAQVCDGLAFIHARGLVHRDVKPSNVLVDDDSVAKVVDFGLVKSTLSSGNTTGVGHVVGTYRYMSPEQARGARVDGRSDLYAVGGILYEMLCGRPPFTHEQTPNLLHAIVFESPVSILSLNPEADVTLAGIAERLLNKSPGSRLASAIDVARRLRAARAGGPS